MSPSSGVEARLRRTVEELERRLGADHPATATALFDLAEVLAGSKRAPVADSPLPRALTIRRERLGGSHPLVARTLAVRGRLLVGMGDSGGGRKALGEAIAIYSQRLATDHPWVVDAQEALSSIR